MDNAAADTDGKKMEVDSPTNTSQILRGARSAFEELVPPVATPGSSSTGTSPPTVSTDMDNAAADTDGKKMEVKVLPLQVQQF
jgi:hypothetical protein